MEETVGSPPLPGIPCFCFFFRCLARGSCGSVFVVWLGLMSFCFGVLSLTSHALATILSVYTNLS